MDMFVDIAYKLGDFDHLEVLNPEKEPASEFSLMLKEEVTKSTPASITSNSERQQFIKATLKKMIVKDFVYFEHYYNKVYREHFEELLRNKEIGTKN